MPANRVGLAVNTLSKLVRSPEAVLQFSKILLQRKVRLPYDYHLGDGQSGPFSVIHMKLVNACNLRCKMCGQWGETGYHFKQAPSYLKELAPLDVMLRMLDDVATVKPWISISGGEAFLHPHIFPILEHAKKLGLVVTVSTNGLSLAQHSARLIDLGIDFMYVSIDGAEENHDRIRGVKGAFQKTVHGIRTIQEEKKKRRTIKPLVILSAAISKDNAHCFDDIFEVGESVEADGMFASYGWFQTEDSCRRHEELMAEKLDTHPISHRGWLWSYGEIDTDALLASIKRIEAKTWSYPYTFLPKLSHDEIPRYYREHGTTFGPDKCKCPWTVVEVLPNGDVATCVDLPDYIAGNIRQNSILDIWNNERYKKFRAVVKEEKHLPACTRCSGLIGRGF